MNNQLQIGIHLTQRELQVLECTIKGFSLRQTGLALEVSDSAVEVHRSNLRTKLGVRGNVGLLIEAIEMGCLEFIVDYHNFIFEKKYSANDLTKREQEVLQYLFYDLKNSQIGDVMGISSRTVDGYKAEIRRKWNVENDIQIAVIGIRQGLIRVPIRVKINQTYQFSFGQNKNTVFVGN